MQSLYSYINEAVKDDVLYHFTMVENILHILNDGYIMSSRDRDPVKGWELVDYVSATRQIDSEIGYPYILQKQHPDGLSPAKAKKDICRIVLDGRAIRARWQVRAYDYFAHDQQFYVNDEPTSYKRSAITKDFDRSDLAEFTRGSRKGWEKRIHRIHMPNVESEDRIYLRSDMDTIGTKYFKEIHSRVYHKKLAVLCEKLGIPYKYGEGFRFGNFKD